MNDTVAALISVWEAWDEEPRNEARAIAYEHACRDLAGGHQAETSMLRAMLAWARRMGLTRELAVDLALRFLAAREAA